MSTRNKIFFALFFIVGLVLLLYAFHERSTATRIPRTLNLGELGVAIEIPGTLHDLTYTAEDDSAEGPGWVLHMYIERTCELGSFYEIQKNAIATSGTTWTEKTLEQFQVPQGNTLSQVKEFTNFYLVFEPNNVPCATTESAVAEENKKRADLWNALTTAHYIQY